MKNFVFNLDDLQDLYIYKKKFMQIITNERQLVNLHVGLMPHFCQYASLCNLPPRRLGKTSEQYIGKAMPISASVVLQWLMALLLIFRCYRNCDAAHV